MNKISVMQNQVHVDLSTLGILANKNATEIAAHTQQELLILKLETKND